METLVRNTPCKISAPNLDEGYVDLDRMRCQNKLDLNRLERLREQARKLDFVTVKNLCESDKKLRNKFLSEAEKLEQAYSAQMFTEEQFREQVETYGPHSEFYKPGRISDGMLKLRNEHCTKAHQMNLAFARCKKLWPLCEMLID